jgi:hypothetical protein
MNKKEIEKLVDIELQFGDPRSPEYREGAIDPVFRRETGAELRKRYYAMGTAQADAYWAGVERGRAIWGKTRDQFTEPI